MTDFGSIDEIGGSRLSEETVHIRNRERERLFNAAFGDKNWDDDEIVQQDPAEEDFMTESRRYPPNHVFTLADMPEGKNENDLIEFATAMAGRSGSGVMGPRMLYKGKVMPVFVAEMYQARVPREDIEFTLKKIGLMRAKRVNAYTPQVSKELLEQGLRGRLTPEQSVRFVSGEGAHRDEAATSSEIIALETRLASYSMYESLEPCRNRLLPTERKRPGYP